MSILSNFTAYVKQVWANRPSLTSPLSAGRLNHIEDGVKANSDAIEQIANAVLSNIVNDPNKIASMATAYALQQQIEKLNSETNNLNPVTLIPSDADLDDYLTIGTYKCPNASVASTLKNCPYTSGGFRLIVSQPTGTTSNYKRQDIETNAFDAKTYARTNSRGTFNKWEKFAMESDFSNAFGPEESNVQFSLVNVTTEYPTRNIYKKKNGICTVHIIFKSDTAIESLTQIVEGGSLPLPDIGTNLIVPLCPDSGSEYETGELVLNTDGSLRTRRIKAGVSYATTICYLCK